MRRRPALFISLAAGLALLVLAVMTLLPSSHRDRERLEEVRCRSNLIQIGMAIREYRDANGGALPDSFATLFRTADLVPENFVCPDDRRVTPARTRDAFLADSGPAHCSYHYLGNGLTLPIARPDEVVIAIDRTLDAKSSVSALFADGHVEALWSSRYRPDVRIAPWLAAIDAQIARGDLPVVLRSPATRPGR